MKTKFIKNFCSKPLLIPGLYYSIDSILSKSFGGYIACWHDLSAKVFKSQIESLHPSKPIPLSELVNRYISGKSTKGCFAITFDDGVGKTVRDISNICETMGWPITFYLPTKYINGGILPYQKIEFIKRYLVLDDYNIPVKISNIQNNVINKNHLIKFLTSIIYTEHFSVVEQILDYFIEKISITDKNDLLINEIPQAISWNEVVTLSKKTAVSFQSHGVNHAALNSLDDNEIEKEMVSSKKIIEEHTGKTVNSFCYPYGTENSIGPRAPKIASKHFSSAVTLIRGRIKKNDPFYLPRFDFYDDDSSSFIRLKVISAI